MKLGTPEEQKQRYENWKESVFKLNPHLQEYQEPYIHWLWANAALIAISEDSFETIDLMYHAWLGGRDFQKHKGDQK
jgi:hypothetical protein